MADVKKLAEELVNLKVTEVNELATILKEEYGIEPAAAAVAVAAPAAGADEATAAKKKTFEEMVSKFDNLVAKAEALCFEDKKMSEWMDSQDVCVLLNISPRTLQTLRDSGRLAYSQINHKTYYLPEDVGRMLPIVEKRKTKDK